METNNFSNLEAGGERKDVIRKDNKFDLVPQGEESKFIDMLENGPVEEWESILLDLIHAHSRGEVEGWIREGTKEWSEEKQIQIRDVFTSLETPSKE